MSAISERRISDFKADAVLGLVPDDASYLYLRSSSAIGPHINYFLVLETQENSNATGTGPKFKRENLKWGSKTKTNLQMLSIQFFFNSIHDYLYNTSYHLIVAKQLYMKYIC